MHDQSTYVSPHNQIVDICNEEHVTLSDLKGPCRNAGLVRVRQRIIKELHGRGIRPSEIARLINRNHATIWHTLKRISNGNNQ